MPEGVEVYLFTKKIHDAIQNKSVQLKLIGGKYLVKSKYSDLQNYCKSTENTPVNINKVFKKGKHTFILFSDNQLLHIQYGLDGLIRVSDSDTPEKHDKLQITVNDDNKKYVYFNDVISYGDLNLLTKSKSREILDNIGIDIMKIKNFNEYYNNITMYNGNKTIGEILLSQSYLSGIGNYMRSELLYMANVYPLKKFADLTYTEHKNIYAAMVLLIKEILKGDYVYKIYGNKEKSNVKLGRSYVYYDSEKLNLHK